MNSKGIKPQFLEHCVASGDKMGEVILEGRAPFIQMLVCKLWEYQTADEQKAEHTVHRNDVGYNSADAPFVGRVIEVWNLGFKVDRKILIQLRLRLFKYRAQLADIIEERTVEAELETLKEIAESTCN